MTQFLAKRFAAGYALLANGEKFGTLFVNLDGKVTGMSFADEEVKSCSRRLYMSGMPTKTIRDYLALGRRAFEQIEEYRIADELRECEADAETERRVEQFYENRMSDADKAQEDEEYANDPWLQALEEGRR